MVKEVTFYLLLTANGRSSQVEFLAANRDEAVAGFNDFLSSLRKHSLAEEAVRLFEVGKDGNTHIWNGNDWSREDQSDFRLVNALLGFGP
jgi:hypothetical protein